MKHIKDYQYKPEPHQRDTQQTPYQPSALVQWLWAKLAVRFGNKWTSQWTDERMAMLGQAEWSAKLQELPEDQVKSIVETWKDEWPPTLQSILTRFSSQRCHKEFTSLPRPKVEPEVAKKYISKIREIL